MQVIFVCTGNTCRSPMAAALLRKKTNAHTVSSAGLSVLYPAPAAENAVTVMAEYGLDISSHRSRQLTDKMVQDADVILTMTNGHKSILDTLFPSAHDKTFTLGAYAGCAEDVDDPFGGDPETYRACAATLARLIGEAPL